MCETFFCMKTPLKIMTSPQSLKNENGFASTSLKTATVARNVDSEITVWRLQRLTVTGNDIYLYKCSPFNDYSRSFIEGEVAFPHAKRKDIWVHKISDIDTRKRNTYHSVWPSIRRRMLRP